MDILIEEFKLERRIREIAQQISDDHQASGNPLPPVMICVLNGAFMFFTDLVKHMDIDCEIDFIRVKSYHGKDNSAGVQMLKGLETELKGKRVYIIEDIIDTGATMVEILQHVGSKQPAEVKVATLVRRAGSELREDYSCFEISDEWIIGFGLDDNGLKRNYRNIYKI
jgi:hypoxanthine phosphoribosyltransferase